MGRGKTRSRSFCSPSCHLFLILYRLVNVRRERNLETRLLRLLKKAAQATSLQLTPVGTCFKKRCSILVRFEYF